MTFSKSAIGMGLQSHCLPAIDAPVEIELQVANISGQADICMALPLISVPEAIEHIMTDWRRLQNS